MRYYHFMSDFEPGVQMETLAELLLDTLAEISSKL